MLLFVDKRFELSNLDLIRDMAGIIKFEEVLSTMNYLNYPTDNQVVIELIQV